MNANFNAIPSGIFNWLEKLTSRIKKNSQMKIDKRHPGYANYFYQSLLSSESIYKFKRSLEENRRFKIDQWWKSGNRSGGGRNAYLCVVFSNIWRERVHSINKISCDSHIINRIRTWMSYNRLPNLGGLIQGNLVSKLRKCFAPKDFVNRECNWRSARKVNGICVYKGNFCKCCVV